MGAALTEGERVADLTIRVGWTTLQTCRQSEGRLWGVHTIFDCAERGPRERERELRCSLTEISRPHKLRCYKEILPRAHPTPYLDDVLLARHDCFGYQLDDGVG